MARKKLSKRQLQRNIREARLLAEYADKCHKRTAAEVNNIESFGFDATDDFGDWPMAQETLEDEEEEEDVYNEEDELIEKTPPISQVEKENLMHDAYVDQICIG